MLPKLCWVVVAALWGADAGALSPLKVTGDKSSNAIVVTLEQAVVDHPTVLSARQASIASSASYDAARWQYYPTPSITTERGSNESQRNYGAATTTTLRLQQNLWAGGRIDTSVKAAQSRVKVAQLLVLESQNTVANRTLDAWLALLTGFGRRQTAQLGLVRLQSLSEMMGRRVDRDVSPNVDLLLMRSRVAQAQSDLLAQSAAQDSASERLEQWVGLASRSQNLDSAALTNVLQEAAVRLPTSTLSEMVDRLHKQPALQRNAAEIELAQDEVDQKKAEIWPMVYLRAERQFGDSAAAGSGVKTVQNKLFVGLQYSPGAGLSVVSNIQAASSRVASLEHDRETIRRESLDHVQSDWREHVTNADRLRGALDAVSGASEVLQSYTRLFVVGRRGWLDVLNAARELNQAELALADLQALQVISLYRLQIHLGLLAWQRDKRNE